MKLETFNYFCALIIMFFMAGIINCLYHVDSLFYFFLGAILMLVSFGLTLYSFYNWDKKDISNTVAIGVITLIYGLLSMLYNTAYMVFYQENISFYNMIHGFVEGVFVCFTTIFILEVMQYIKDYKKRCYAIYIK